MEHHGLSANRSASHLRRSAIFPGLKALVGRLDNVFQALNMLYERGVTNRQPLVGFIWQALHFIAGH